MNIKELMSVSGRPGLYRLIATKQTGIVAESLETGQKKFFSARSHQFSPLESIAIYTYTDALPLEDVFTKMKENPPADDLAKNEMRDYFTEILPDHDQSRVYASDIKKIVTWFTYLNENGYLDEEEEAEAEAEAEVEVSSSAPIAIGASADKEVEDKDEVEEADKEDGDEDDKEEE